MQLSNQLSGAPVIARKLMNIKQLIRATTIVVLISVPGLLISGCGFSFIGQPDATPTPMSLEATSWEDFPITDFAALHSPVNGDANEHLIFGAIPVSQPAENLDPSLSAFLGRWEGFDYAPPIKKDSKGVLVIQEITPQGGIAYLWSSTNLQYPYWVKEIHFRVVPGDKPVIEWQGDISGGPGGSGGIFTFAFTMDQEQDALVGGLNVSHRDVLDGTSILTRDRSFYVYKDYESYLTGKRIYSKQYINPDLQQYGQGYLVYLPEGYEEQPEKEWPLIYFLHGSGDRGDNTFVLAKASPFMMIREIGSLPCIIVAPLLNDSNQYRSFPQDYMDGVLAEALAEYRVDQKRIYLTGLSMGGEATYRFALHEPHTFAAIAPLAAFDARFFPNAAGWGYEPSTEPLAGMKDVPVWSIHGADDRIIPLSAAQAVVDALTEAGANVRFTVLEDHDHDVWTDVYSDPQFYDWLLQYQLP